MALPESFEASFLAAARAEEGRRETRRIPVTLTTRSARAAVDNIKDQLRPVLAYLQQVSQGRERGFFWQDCSYETRDGSYAEGLSLKYDRYGFTRPGTGDCYAASGETSAGHDAFTFPHLEIVISAKGEEEPSIRAIYTNREPPHSTEERQQGFRLFALFGRPTRPDVERRWDGSWIKHYGTPEALIRDIAVWAGEVAPDLATATRLESAPALDQSCP